MEKTRCKLRDYWAQHFVWGCLTGLMVLAAGCSPGKPRLSSDQRKSLESAPTAVKQVWDKALAAEQAKEYVIAQNLFESLVRMDLTSQQRQAVNAEFFVFQQQLWQAAEKGDPAAVKAVQEINKTKR